MSKIKIYAKSIIIPVVVGIVVGLIIAPAMDYSNLQKPPLAPPSILFPIVWTILYILMGVSYGILESKGQTNRKIDSTYYGQLTVNALWSIIFFILKWRFFAFIWIIVLDILIIQMIKEFYKEDRTAGLLQIPYLLWSLFATYLTLAIYILNN